MFGIGSKRGGGRVWVGLEAGRVLLARCARVPIGALVLLGCARGAVFAAPEQKVEYLGHSSDKEYWIAHEEAVERYQNVE